MTITMPRTELDTPTHVANVRAFMSATLRFTGLADQTYLDMVARGMPQSLISDLYPFDAVQIVTTWAEHAEPWFTRHNRWDQLLHMRQLNGFAGSVLELQRYTPSLYLRDFVPNPLSDSLPISLVQLNNSLDDLFIIEGHAWMNPHVKDLLNDMFNAAAFLNGGGDFDSIYPNQVRQGSKAQTNAGFEAALANFFAALGRLIDMREAVQR